MATVSRPSAVGTAASAQLPRATNGGTITFGGTGGTYHPLIPGDLSGAQILFLTGEAIDCIQIAGQNYGCTTHPAPPVAFQATFPSGDDAGTFLLQKLQTNEWDEGNEVFSFFKAVIGGQQITAGTEDDNTHTGLAQLDLQGGIKVQLVGIASGDFVNSITVQIVN